MKNYFFILFVICFLVSSCNAKTSKQNAILSSTIDTFHRDVPLNNDTKEFKAMKEEIESKEGLASIENGVDSLEIRIGFSFSAGIEQDVIIKKINGKWDGEIGVITYNREVDNKTKLINRYAKKVAPKCGWDIFIDSLIKLQILTLPDMTTLQGYEINNGGKGISVEIATKSYYRSYWYENSEGYRKKYWQVANMEKIAILCEKELEFKRMW